LNNVSSRTRLQTPAAGYGPCCNDGHAGQVVGVNRIKGIDVVVGGTAKDGVYLGEPTEGWEVDSCSHLDGG